MVLRLVKILLVFLAFSAHSAGAAQADARLVLHLLDYIAVDYGGAVEDGRVRSADEYREMQEFALEAVRGVAQLPDHASRASLATRAESLRGLIERKADAKVVAQAAIALRDAVVAAYGIATAPRTAPDEKRGQTLYLEHCASCHGAAGKGDGVAARGMTPAPADLTDRARMAQRSAFAVYNAITLGVKGTAMPSFAALPEQDRWALAFHAAALSVPAELRSRGEAAWRLPGMRAIFSGLEAVASVSPAEIAGRHGGEAQAVQAFLLSRPSAWATQRPDPLAIARDRIVASLRAYGSGDGARASRLAVEAYLDGFELVERTLAQVDSDLVERTERAMMAYRQAVASNASQAEVQTRAKQVLELVDRARERLGSESLSAPATFLASLVIVMREGLEAVLVLAAVFAFLRKAGRRDARRYAHAGWIAALLLGVATWAVSSELIEISGAGREITEGVTALIAAAMLLYVGYWLHDKAHADAWQALIRTHVGGALSSGKVWTLAAVSFLAVYREVFETVLFYQALGSQAGADGRAPLLAGMAAGAVLLFVAAWFIVRWSARLPIGPFFKASGLLLAALAVIFTGQGVAALQEAGWLGVYEIPFLRVPMLGMFPTAQSLVAQLAVVIAIAVALALRATSRRRARTSAP